MKFPAAICLLAVSVFTLPAQSTIEVGAGAPNDFIRGQFAAAYNRGSFSATAALPPTGTVRRFGTTGLVQEFSDATRSGGRLALVRATSVATPDDPSGEVYQVLTDVYGYFSSVGVGTAGYPVSDTQFCPDAACTWQAFDRNYALFAWVSGANDPQTITVRDPFFTRWVFYGGVSRMGVATSAETDVTSSFGTAAIRQTFRNGSFYSFSSGALAGTVVSVRQPILALHEARGGFSGALGLATAEEQTLVSGKHRQTFEGGVVEYDDQSGPVVRTTISSIQLRSASNPLRLNAGETAPVQAVVFGSDGTELLDRQVNFIVSNGRVISVQSSGLTATVRALGGGTARLTATSEGKTSNPIDVVVVSRCCAVGEGAPTAAIQQAFQDAATRTRARLQLPGAERVQRAGSGYVQQFQASDGAGRFLFAMSDKSAQVWLVTTPLLEGYEALGGPLSALGYPTADGSAGGRQLFEGGALAGNPPRAVSGDILSRWVAAGLETGAVGLPVANAVPVTSFTGAAGQVQRFQNGLIASGPKGGFLLSGAAAEFYAANGGAESSLGFPVGEAAASGAARRQEFEGGFLEYGDGAEVRLIQKERHPAVTANPGSVLAGGRLRLTIAGFAGGALLRVSVTGQADFSIPTQTGAFAWDALVPASTPSGTIRVRAVDAGSGAAAETTYQVRSASEVRFQMSKASGDTQAGAPGGVLPNALRVLVRDDAGTPVSGLTVQFTASPGSRVSPSMAVTDSAGFAETSLTLPASDGVALVTAEGGRQVVTFSARAAGTSLSGFPAFAQGESGALAASVAAVLRYYQAKGALPSPNGLADAAALSDFLGKLCLNDAEGSAVCDGYLRAPTNGTLVPNIWRVGRFVGGNVEISPQKTDPTSIRALVAGGSPLILAMRVTSEAQRGSHFVVATGIGTDGSVQINDPDPMFGRTRLAEYVEGFSAGGRKWTGEVAAVLRVVPGAMPRGAFAVLTWGPTLRLSSRSGECGSEFSWPAQPVSANQGQDPGVLAQRFCDGSAAEYQLDLTGSGGARALVLSLDDAGGQAEVAAGGSAAFRVSSEAGLLTVQPQEARLAARAVVNSANYTPDIAPGSLVSIFGSGLARNGRETTVTIGGRAATVTAAFPFQINAQVPLETPPGLQALRVASPWGTAEQTVEVHPVAPAIFTAGSGWAIVNPDGTLNSPARPARRGDAVVIYATGLGEVSPGGVLRPVKNGVSALVRTQALQVTYAGLAPGFTGVYQINCVIPVTIAPGLSAPVVLRQQSASSPAVEISIF